MEIFCNTNVFTATFNQVNGYLLNKSIIFLKKKKKKSMYIYIYIYIILTPTFEQ